MRTCIRGAKIITAEGILEKRDLVFEEQIVTIAPFEQGEGATLYHDGYICAGFIDLSVHGAAGADSMEATPEAFQKIAEALPQSGVTSFLATTQSDSPEKIDRKSVV